MLGILLLLTLNTGQLNSSYTSLQKDLKPVISASSIITSETCQNGPVREFDLSDIEGHKVNKLLYLQVKDILKQARKEGKPISLNSTFRPCAEQSSLRKSNCGGDTSLPAEACSPPTEKPGESLHNYGMAIDFKCDDSPIFANSSCYTWLKTNAQKYKLQQRAEEPWHWSFTGK
ncbi:MAG: D-alanyl-D-alanine carboxypeptidase family protein [Candidatus Nomurabacteria bacterium]|nr:MAG: D-alanyl-D-alanine carboxypeptidase family protein [Candidatus Nomurabacteria bacterium]HRV76029.1 M15 family metallopeptidase [Candidatus Saccharimonadales bacterium]